MKIPFLVRLRNLESKQQENAPPGLLRRKVTVEAFHRLQLLLASDSLRPTVLCSSQRHWTGIFVAISDVKLHNNRNLLRCPRNDSCMAFIIINALKEINFIQDLSPSAQER
jgi:hypothetical protein